MMYLHLKQATGPCRAHGRESSLTAQMVYVNDLKDGHAVS